MDITIDGRQIGAAHPAFLIAEVGQAHDGSLGMAHCYVDAAADAGVDAIKFQTHIAVAESTLDESFRVHFSQQDETRFDYWRRMEFTAEQWASLATHARERNLTFLSTPFSLPAVELLDHLGVPAWKVGSGEFRSRHLLEVMIATRRPVLFSTGMCDYAEVAEAVSVFRSADTPFALFQCTSKYPTPMDQVGLNVMDQFRERFDCPVGLSDHSGSIWPALATVARGYDLLEAHITFDRRLFGPDTKASLTVDEFRQIADARDRMLEMDRNPVDKDVMAEDLAEMRRLFTKSLAPVRALEAGTVLEAGMLALKKPGNGIPEAELPALLGRRLKRAVTPERLLSWDDLDVASNA